MNTYRVTFRAVPLPVVDYTRPAEEVEADKMDIAPGAVKFFKGKTAFLIYPMDLIFNVELLNVSEDSNQPRRGIKDPDAPDGEPRIVSPMSDDMKSQVDAVEKAGRDGIGKEY